MHQNPRKPRDSDTGPPCHPREYSRPSILIQPHGEPALHGHACTLQHAPGTVRLHPVVEPGRGSRHTRRDADDRPTPRKLGATSGLRPPQPHGPGRPPHRPMVTNHARILHSTGTKAPCSSPPDRQATPRSEPGPRHAPHPARTRTTALHLESRGHVRPPAQAGSTRQDRSPLPPVTTRTTDHKRLGSAGPHEQATRNQGTSRQHSVVPRQCPAVGQERQPRGPRSKAASH